MVVAAGGVVVVVVVVVIRVGGGDAVAIPTSAGIKESCKVTGKLVDIVQC